MLVNTLARGKPHQSLYVLRNTSPHGCGGFYTATIYEAVKFPRYISHRCEIPIYIIIDHEERKHRTRF